MKRSERVLASVIVCAVATIWPISISSAENYSGDFYGGVDINQRTIDGEREPLNKYLLKRRNATQENDPGAAGPQSVPQKRPTKPAP